MNTTSQKDIIHVTTLSDKLCRCTYLNVRIVSNDKTKSALFASVPVFVVDGLNCLLGRPAMKQIMPKLYKNLTDMARKSREALHDAPVIGRVALSSPTIGLPVGTHAAAPTTTHAAIYARY